MTENFFQLAKAIQNGDKKAAERFYSLTYKQAYLTAMSIVTDQADAPKLVKDVYVGFFSNIGALKNPNELELEFYKELDQGAKQYLNGKKPGLFSAKSADSGAIWTDNKNTVTTAVAPNAASAGMNTIYALPEDQKLALIMYYSQNMTTAQISSTLGLDENEVKGRLAMALSSVEGLAAQAGTNSASLSYMALEGAQSSITAPKGQFNQIMTALATAPAPAVSQKAAQPMQAQNIPPQTPQAKPAQTQNIPPQNVQPPQADRAPQNSEQAFVSPFAGSQPSPQNTQPAPYDSPLPQGEPFGVTDGEKQPYSDPNQKKGMPLGAKIGLIAAGVVVVAAIVAVILYFTVCSGDSGEDEPVTPTTPTYSSSTEAATEAETQPETEATASSGAIFDESYALPDDYEVEGGSFDKTKGYIPAFDADEKTTIEFIESLPQIKPIIDDDDAYVRKEVTQDINNKTRNIYNYYDGYLSVFIDTDSLYSEASNSITLMLRGEFDENRSIAKSILEQIKLDEQLINALIYSDMSESLSLNAKNGTGSYSLSNEISEDSMNISINFYPDTSSEGDVQVSAKYYDTELEKEVNLNSIFNNPDIDFSKDLFDEGVYDIGPSWDNSSGNTYSDISVTKDQNNKVVETTYNLSNTLHTKSSDDDVNSETLYLSYTDNSEEYDEGRETSIDMNFYYNEGNSNYRSDVAKLALAQLKKFDKDIKLTEKDLTLSEDDSETEVEFETSFGDVKGNVEITDDDGSIYYTITWTYDD